MTKPHLNGWLWGATLAISLSYGTVTAIAKDIGAEPPKRTCGAGKTCTPCATGTCTPCNQCGSCQSCPAPEVSHRSHADTQMSRTEGNISERVDIATVMSAGEPTLSLAAVYNSYNADMSRAQVDTVMGYGWTHSYNDFLFSQVGSMFRYDGEGRVTRYKLGAGGTFTAAAGYFETLVKSAGNIFTLKQKDGTTYTFKPIAGTPFVVVGPVYRLTSIVDRNGNTTTLTYAAGRLTSVSDTYGRAITFTYTAQNKVQTVTDPAGRVTTFQYDGTGRKLTRITDSIPKFIQYTYNTVYQLTSKVDKAGLTYTYTYTSLKPTSIHDSSGTTSATHSNPTNWGTDNTQLAMNQLRVYTPTTTTNTDGRGNQWRYAYDSRGYITRLTEPNGAQTNYTYDASTLMVSTVTDPLGRTTSYTYDATGNRQTTTTPLGQVTTYTYEPIYNQVATVTDPRGRTTSYTYDGAGNRTQEVDPSGGSRSWTYNSNGNLLTETDKNGNTTTYAYDGQGNRVQMTDPLGNPTTYTYDGVGNQLTMTGPLSRVTTYQYDGMNRLTGVIDAAGGVTSTQYDGRGNLMQVTDQNGNATMFQYDLRHRLTQVTDAAGKFESSTYDGNDNRVSRLDRNNKITAYQYDAQNRLTRVTDAPGNQTNTTYDSAGNVLTVSDGNNNITTYTYDALDRQATVTGAIGNLTRYDYDTGTMAGCPLCGATPGSPLVTKLTDANGKVTYFKYDALDRLITTVRKVGSVLDTITPADAVTTTTYDAQDNRLTMVEPNGNVTAYTYDARNRLSSETNAAGDLTQTTYDSAGNVQTMTSPNGNVTTYVYDSLNRRVTETDSVGLVATYSYDAVGNRTSLGDGNGSTTTYAYDSLDRLTTTTDALGQPATSQYDAVGNQTQIVDRNGNATAYTYDAVNRRTGMVDALGYITSYQYDPVGNRTGITDANGRTTTYQYDAINRETRETYADGTFRTTTYDPVGNALTRTDGIGQVTSYVYDDLHRLTSRNYPSLVNDTFTYDLSGRMLSALRGAWPVTFAYDGANRVTQTDQNGRILSYSYDVPARTRTVTYPGGRVITEQTDLRSRLDTIDDGSSPPPIVDYTYDLGNRMTLRTFRNGTTATPTYNANNWMTSLEHQAGVPNIALFNYQYDDEGNKNFEEKFHDAGRSEAYQYDTVNRLIEYRVGTLSGSTVPVPVTQTAYNLDGVGNWNSKVTDLVIQNRMHSTVNALTMIDAQGITPDANGNLRNDGAYSYVYDEENRLVSATRLSDSALVGQYQYDALGRRVVKVASPAMTFDTTVYLYDDQRIVEEQNGSGSTQATYVYGTGMDDVLTMNRGGQTYYYHQNALGSVIALTNGTSAIVERYAYDAYGRPTITDGAGTPVPVNPWSTAHSDVANPYMFTARQLDEETGLYFYRARYYDADQGRFLQRDPFEYAPGMNLYEYVASNPTRFVDPTGRAYENLTADQLAQELGLGTAFGEAGGANYAVGLAYAYLQAVKNEQELRKKCAELNIIERRKALTEWVKNLDRDNKSIAEHYIKFHKRLPTAKDGFTAKPFTPPADRFVVKNQRWVYAWYAKPLCEGFLYCVDTKTNKTTSGETFYNTRYLAGFFTSGYLKNE